MDTTLSGGRLKFLMVIDAFSRYVSPTRGWASAHITCLSIKVDRTMTSSDVVAELERLMILHGLHNFVRCDNGPEFISQAAQKFLADAKIETLFIDPGSPWQTQRSAEALPSGYSESFSGRFRDELLNLEVFASTLEARVLSETWRRRL